MDKHDTIKSSFDRFIQMDNSACSITGSNNILEIFETAVENNPLQTALIYETDQLTYSKLNDLSNQMARYIQDCHKKSYGKQLTPGTVIALCISRNFEMIIAILGVLKAGAAYTIINPELPPEGILFVTENSNSKLLIEFNSNISKNKLSILARTKNINLLQPTQLMLARYNKAKLTIKISTTDLAYIMYTSGTTGAQKGVRVSHKSLAFFCCSYAKTMNLRPGIVVDYILSPVFTGSIPCYFPTILFGATLLIQPLEIILSPKQYVSSLIKHRATILKYTPTIFNLLLPYLYKNTTNGIKIVLSGEALLFSQIKQCMETMPWEIYNQYGFTECVAGFCIYKITLREIASDYVPVGKPYSGRKMLILDEQFRVVAKHGSGELFAGGNGLADGYQNLDDETAQKFITLKKERYYRTGDIVKINKFGNLEIIQRKDDQIKINGIRIELAAIENKILEITGVKSCVVTLMDINNTNNKELVAYFSCSVKNSITDKIIKAHLQKYLPPYMIPQFFILVNQFPYTENGKIDKKKLFLNNPIKLANEPLSLIRSKCQKEILQIWTDVLKIPAIHIGKNSDFFTHGGNSLKAYQILIRLNEKFLTGFTTQDMLTCRTIAAQENFIQKRKKHKNVIKLTNINEEF